MLKKIFDRFMPAKAEATVTLKKKRLVVEIVKPVFQCHMLELKDYGLSAVTFVLEKEDEHFSVVAMTQNEHRRSDEPLYNELFRAKVASEGAGVHIIRDINKLLTKRLSLLKVFFGIVLAWLAWLFVSSYIDVIRAGNNATGTSALGSLEQQMMPASPSLGAEGLPKLPGDAKSQIYPAARLAKPAESLPYATPIMPPETDVAKSIYDTAMAAQTKAFRDNAPAMPSDITSGLESFGLSPDIDSGQTVGPGCDPKLAFKVSE